MPPESLPQQPHTPTQEELRAKLKQRFDTLGAQVEEKIDEYKRALKERTFEGPEGEKRRETLQKEIQAGIDQGQRLKTKIESPNPLPQIETTLTATYTHPDKHQEQISIDIEAQIQEYIAFYKKTNINLPPNFEDTIKEVWERNYTEIQEAIEQNGFDEILIIPGNIPLTEIKDKMSMENGYYEGSNFTSGGSFTSAQSPTTVQRPRIVLVHKTQNLRDRPELASTLNVKGQDLDPNKILSLEDYIIWQRRFHDLTGKHLDEVGWTWTSTKSGSRLVYAGWNPGDHGLSVDANDPDYQGSNLGARPSRCFV